MKAIPRQLMRLSAGALFALSAHSTCATSIQDLVRIKGHEKNILTGMGIVVGLNGTGDESKDSLVAARPFAELLRNLGNHVSGVEELAEADAYAIVNVTMEVPAKGVREGDRLDIQVETLFNATSLDGGRLVVSLLRLPRPDAFDLQDLSKEYGVDKDRYEKAASFCIHCDLCVRYCAEIKKANAVGFVDLGTRKEINSSPSWPTPSVGTAKNASPSAPPRHCRRLLC